MPAYCCGIQQFAVPRSKQSCKTPKIGFFPAVRHTPYKKPKSASLLARRRPLSSGTLCAPGKNPKSASLPVRWLSKTAKARECLSGGVQKPKNASLHVKRRLFSSQACAFRVDMTSTCQVPAARFFFFVLSLSPPLVSRDQREARPINPTVDHADIRGLATTLFVSVRRLSSYF